MAVKKALDPGAFDAVTFDCYGTLIDWETGVLSILRPWATETGVEAKDDPLLSAFAHGQRAAQRRRPVWPYPRVVADAFRHVGESLGVTVSDDWRQRLARSIGDWPSFPDTVEALACLKERYRLGVLSNVDNASFARTHGHLGNIMDLIVTAEDVGAYKPDPAHFERAVSLFLDWGVPRDRVLHAAQSRFHDVAPCRALGLSCVHVDRRHGKTARGLTVPATNEADWSVHGLAELVAFLSDSVD